MPTRFAAGSPGASRLRRGGRCLHPLGLQIFGHVAKLGLVHGGQPDAGPVGWQLSKEMEIKLTNVGRASLEELLADYRDYLRVRDHVIWDKDSKEAQFVRRLGRVTPHTFEIYREFMETRPPEIIANIAICLIHQTNYLIDQQLKTLEKEFIEQGGLRERMTRVRLENRNNQGKK